jgi:hypothetical protein
VFDFQMFILLFLFGLYLFCCSALLRLRRRFCPFFSPAFAELVFDFQMFILLFLFGLYLFVVLLCSTFGGDFAPFFLPLLREISI